MHATERTASQQSNFLPSHCFVISVFVRLVRARKVKSKKGKQEALPFFDRGSIPVDSSVTKGRKVRKRDG